MKAVIAGTEGSLPPPDPTSSGINTSMVLIIVTMIIAIVAIVLAIIAMFLPATTTGAYVKSQIVTVDETTSTSLPGGNINGTLFYLVSSSSNTKPSVLIIDNSTIISNSNFAVMNTNITTDIIVKLVNFPNLNGPIEIILNNLANQLTAYVNSNGQITYSVYDSYPQIYQNGVAYYPSLNVIQVHNVAMQDATSVTIPAEIYLNSAPAAGAGGIYVAPSGMALLCTSNNTNLEYYLALYTDGIVGKSGYNYIVNNTTGTINYGFGMKATFTGVITNYPYSILPGGFALIVYYDGVIRVATTQ